jgi:hypothetical protein
VADLLPDRLAAVLAVVYLIFNQGYGGRGDLASEAIRLGRALVELMPDEPEAHGLLALMLLHDARREARFQGDELVLLADQDRSLWNEPQIANGRALLDRAVALHGRGPYVIQAAIASLHTEHPRDWGQIAALYGALVRLTVSPVIELSWAIAIAESQGPQAGLEIIDRLALGGLSLSARNPRRAAAPPRTYLGSSEGTRACAHACPQRRGAPAARATTRGAPDDTLERRGRCRQKHLKRPTPRGRGGSARSTRSPSCAPRSTCGSPRQTMSVTRISCRCRSTGTGQA